MKTINYLGIRFKVQDEINFVATDSGGNVCGFKNFPIPIKGNWEGMTTDDKPTFLIKVRLINMDWMNSIKEV